MHLYLETPWNVNIAVETKEGRRKTTCHKSASGSSGARARGGSIGGASTLPRCTERGLYRLVSPDFWRTKVRVGGWSFTRKNMLIQSLPIGRDRIVFDSNKGGVGRMARTAVVDHQGQELLGVEEKRDMEVLKISWVVPSTQIRQRYYKPLHLWVGVSGIYSSNSTATETTYEQRPKRIHTMGASPSTEPLAHARAE